LTLKSGGLQFIKYTFLFFLLSLSVKAQELEPRIYGNLPKNFNAAALSYIFSTGEISTNPASPIKDFEVSIHTVAAGYVRTFSLFKKLARVQLIVPYSHMAGDLTYKGRDTSGTRTGFLDSRLRLGINIFGSPALSFKEFRTYKQRGILGASLVISIPTGQYFDERLINLGANRWAFKPEVGISKDFGATYVEFYTGIWFFTDNKSYLSTKILSQTPLYSLQGHASYIFHNGMWIGFNANYVNGGQSSVDGVKQDDYQRKLRLGITGSYPINWQHSIKLQYHTGVYTNIGSGYDIFALTYQFVWL
jgi:hypothetical protein